MEKITRRKCFFRDFLFATLVIIVASIVGTVFNALRPGDGITFYPAESNETVYQFEELFLEEVMDAFYQETKYFIDARSPSEFMEGHIPGSRNIPYKDVEKDPSTYEFNIPEDKPIIVYCGGGECELSKSLAMILMEKGYKKIQVFPGGWTEWLDNGLPVETGEVEDSKENIPQDSSLVDKIGLVITVLFILVYILFPEMVMVKKLRWILTHPLTLLVIRGFTGGLFIYASMDKLISPSDFMKIVKNYHMLPQPILPIFSLLLPWIEMVSGSLLILGVFIRSNVMIIILLLIIFSIAIFSASVRGIDTSCGCFSTKDTGGKVGWRLLFRDMLLLFFMIQFFWGKSNLLAFENIFIDSKR